MTAVVDLAYPFHGRWLVQNSPADRVPSHGTTRFASSYAIDFVPVDAAGRSASVRLTTLVRAEPPELFPGFGRDILAPRSGTVIGVVDAEADHPAYRGMPSIGYALTQGRRAAAGWRAVAGNHVLIDAGVAIVALCHLQRGSARVSVGQRLRVGETVARCGNSGNSTEPHVHLQALSMPDPDSAIAVPITFAGALPISGTIVEA